MEEYICKKTCYFQDQLFKAGQRASFSESVKVPKHFEPIKKAKDKPDKDKKKAGQ